ncbi:MAG: ABC transporter ATP-binding protein [Ruminococcaceae bacterium]|nr:ABC transporter ATP-binding protein [Oscillospiraceae bacterium]
MNTLGKIPDTAVSLLEAKGISKDDILLITKSDMSYDMTLCDCYAVLTKEAVVILAVGETIQRDEKSGFFTPNRIKSTVLEYGYKYYTIKELSDMKITDNISSGRLTAKLEDTEGASSEDNRITLFYFTNTKKSNVRVFAECFKKYKETSEFPEELYKKHTESVCPKCKNKYPDGEKKICPHCMSKKTLIKKLLPFFSKYKFQIFLIFLTIIISTALSLLSPYISGKVFYDEVLTESGSMYGKIGTILIVIVLANLLSHLFSMANGLINARVTAWVTYDLKKTIFSSFGKLSLAFFTGRHTGGLMTQINSDATSIYWFFCDGFPYFCMNIIKLVGIIILLFTIDVKLTLLTLVPIPLFALAYKLVLNVFKKLHARNYSKRRSVMSIVSDVLSGIRVVKAFSRESTEIARFDKRNVSFAESSLKISKVENTVFPLVYYLIGLGSYLIWIFGGWSVITHGATGGAEGISYGSLMLFVSYMSMVVEPLRFLSDVSGHLAECFNSLQRLFEIMEAKVDVEEKEDPIELTDIKGRIEFKSAEFSYTKDKKTLENISFTVEPGKTLGIVGHTGAGKSTLANLLTRLYDVDSGEVLIDGVNIKDISFRSLHDAIAIVSQETYLFRGSILDNIRYAKPEASYEEVIAASKAAGAHDFIIKYPDGYHTNVGMDQKQLSGGERQRVSIARAILKQPKILILDEATAAMDTQTERMIQNALSEITKGKTTIIIAHRLSTLRDADNLIVIENRTVTESGTHKELILKKGSYYKLYKLQLEALKTIGITE